MLAKANMSPSPGENYVYEYKWDGYRTMASVLHGEAHLYSRNGLSFDLKFSSILKDLRQIKESVVLDGEMVAVNKENVPEFQLIQNNETNGAKIKYYLFDLLYLNGEKITAFSYLERRELLKLLFNKYKFKNVMLSEMLSGSKESLMKKAGKKKLEGIIAKRSDSNYVPGKRSSAWIKLKIFNTQSVVICGFTAPQGSRKKFGALILGVYEGKELKYAGHCGTGFTDESLADLYKKMKPLITNKPAFKKIPETNQPATWIKPALIGEVEFTEWTKDGALRHAAFKGLREDLILKEIKREPTIQNKERYATKSK